MNKPMSLLVCFLIPVIFLLLGLALAGSFAYREIPRLFEEEGRGVIPDRFTVTLGEPGKYTVWLISETKVESEALKEMKLPPGGKIHIFDANQGTQIPLNNWIQSTRISGGEQAVSLGHFQVNQPGMEVEIKGSGVRREFTLSVSQSNMGRTLRVVMTLLTIVLISLSVAIFIFIALLHRRQKVMESNATS